MDEEDDPWLEDQSMTDEEDVQWADDCSNTDSDEELYEEDPEPEPPDPYQDDPHSTDWSRKKSDPEEGYESDSWQEETEAENSLEISEDWDHESEEETQLQLDVQEDLWEDQTNPDAEQDDMPWYEDTNSQLSLGETDHKDEETWNREDEQDSFGTNSENEEEAITHSTYFSGYGQRDETYPQWEDEMEALFQSHHVPEEEKLSYATKTLIGPALAWWKRKQHAQWVPDTVSYPKGTLQPERKKAGVVLESGEPQTKDEAMAQESFDPGIKQEDERPTNGERFKENQGQHLTCPQNVEAVTRNNKSTQAVKEQIILQLVETIWTKDHMYDPHKEITRCLYAKRKQEIVHSHTLIPYDPGDQAPPIRVPDQNRGVVLSFLPKGEPPDLPSKIKPIKYHVKMASFSNQDEVCHKTNFHGFYTPGMSQNRWNQPKIYLDQEDTNFINRKFSTPSICEYPSLKAVSSPMKKSYVQEKLMEFKMDLLAFQKSKNEEKSPRKM
ncbi:hypothetical protein F2Q70_00025808 [Brassica cretica]|uniref:Uncharacterized protein n=1 Tax=Brassica cretica TaxID=69181 RepID=A0A8S9L9H0_BRACR|nr:hypothetical protein F2Q70_00025808 [Brassica cretica]